MQHNYAKTTELFLSMNHLEQTNYFDNMYISKIIQMKHNQNGRGNISKLDIERETM